MLPPKSIVLQQLSSTIAYVNGMLTILFLDSTKLQYHTTKKFLFVFACLGSIYIYVIFLRGTYLWDRELVIVEGAVPVSYRGFKTSLFGNLLFFIIINVGSVLQDRSGTKICLASVYLPREVEGVDDAYSRALAVTIDGDGESVPLNALAGR